MGEEEAGSVSGHVKKIRLREEGGRRILIAPIFVSELALKATGRAIKGKRISVGRVCLRPYFPLCHASRRLLCQEHSSTSAPPLRGKGREGHGCLISDVKTAVLPCVSSDASFCLRNSEKGKRP